MIHYINQLINYEKDVDVKSDLFDALLSLETREEAMNFIVDLCTPQEIKSLQERWKVAQLLSVGKFSYREIHHIAGASLTTIGRVARFLKEEKNKGYQLVLQKCKRLK